MHSRRQQMLNAPPQLAASDAGRKNSVIFALLVPLAVRARAPACACEKLFIVC